MKSARSAPAPRRSAVAALLGCALSLAHGSARADDREQAAAEVFRAGAEAYARHEYRAAALAFEAAFREVPHAASAYNAARAWERAGEPARAADLYQAALAVPQLTDDETADARARVAALEPTLGAIEVEAPALVSVAHVARARAPVRVHLTPGQYEVRLELPDGRDDRQRIRVGRGERIVVTPPAAVPARAVAPAPRSAPPRGATSPRSEGGSSALIVAGWVTLAGAAALGGTAIALGVMALDARDDFDASGWTREDLSDRAASLRTWTNVAWVASGAAVVAGGVMLLAAPSAPSSRAAAGAPRLGVGPGTLTLYGRF